ncbi:MAG: hypothetical protein PUJ57_00230 [Peptoniphilaceae bacterium]|nr:hypothetical protein [Peptoniphilaceae bacterium]MDY6086303.1 hypothetical protein [Peptoniphilaceae bacterium]
MASIFGIVSQYQDRLTMLPVTLIVFVLATLLLYLIFHRYPWVKYVPAVIGIALGLIFLVQGLNQKATLEGLDILWRAVYFFVAGCIALATAWLSALIQSFSRRREDADVEGE